MSPYERLLAAQRRIGERAFAPLTVPVALYVTDVDTDSLGNATVAYGTIDGEGRFPINALGRSVRPGQTIMAGVSVANPSGELTFLGYLSSDVAGTGLVRDEPGPPPDYATTWATTEISTSPALIGSYLIVHFTGDAITQFNPMSYIVSYQIDGEAEWADVEIPHLGGEQSVRLPRLLPPGVTVNVHLRTRYSYASVPSEASEDRSWAAAANSASPGAATGLTASVAVAGRIRLEASGTIPDAANFYGWRYEIATSAGGAGLVTRTVNGPLDYEPPAAGNYYVAVAPVSMSGVVGTRYPGPLSFNGPLAVTTAAAPLDTTAPPAWGAPTLATRQVQLPDGSPQLYVKVTFPAYSYPADYDRTSVRIYDGTNYNFVTVPYNGVAHDPIEFPAPYGTTTVDLKGFDKVGNSPVGFGTSANVTVAAPGIPSAAGNPSVAQIGLALRASWTVPSGAEWVELERSTDAAGANAVSRILVGDSFVDIFTDQAVPLTSYWYRVRGVNKAGNGAWSSRISGTVQPLTGSFLVADSVTALEIAAGTITGNELNANIVLGSIIATAASGTRWEIRGSGVAAPASVVRFIENVGGTDKERVRLEGSGLTVYGDGAQTDVIVRRNSSSGRGEIIMQGVTISHNGTNPYISIATAPSGGGLGQLRLAALWGTDIIQQGTYGSHDTHLWTRPGTGSDDPILAVYDSTLNLQGKLGMWGNGIGASVGGGSDGITWRADASRWYSTGGIQGSHVVGGADNSLGYYGSSAPFYFRQASSLGTTGGNTQRIGSFHYPTGTANMVLDMLAYRGQNGSNDDDARFWLASLSHSVLDGGGLQLGVRNAADPFFGLYTGATARLYWDHANTRVLIPNGLRIDGALSKASGSFVIDDPTPGYEGWELRHCFNESPNAGTNFYVYKAAFGPRGGGLVVTDSEGKKVDGATIAQAEGRFSVTIPLPDYWPHLNTLQSVIAHNTGDGWGRCKARVSEDLATLTLETEEGGEYTIDLRGVRKDPAALEWWGRRGIRKTKAQRWESTPATLDRRAESLRVREAKANRRERIVPLGMLVGRQRFYGNAEPHLNG